MYKHQNQWGSDLSQEAYKDNIFQEPAFTDTNVYQEHAFKESNIFQEPAFTDTNVYLEPAFNDNGFLENVMGIFDPLVV